MNRVIYPFKYDGSVHINSSKSLFQRILALSCFSKKSFIINGLLEDDDSIVAKDICEKIGLSVSKNNSCLEINGTVLDLDEISVDTKESGLSTRVFAVLLSSLFNQVKISLDGTAKKRKFDFSSLEELGVLSSYEDGVIYLRGKLSSGKIIIQNSDTSQLLTGLLITLPFLKNDSIVVCTNLVSKTYIDITLDLLEQFGIIINNDSYKTFSIPGNQVLNKNKINVEGDWSSAAFHFVGAAISGKVDVYGLNLNSCQGDKLILKVLKECGADVSINDGYINVQKNNLNSFIFDATDTPDLFPPLVALASCCEGTSLIYGTNRLINKESNRLISIQKEFLKLGVDISLEENCLKIKGSKTIKGGLVNSHHDHRIAMALSIMASVAESSVTITDSNVVSKSYSRFYEDLEKVSKIS